MSDAKSRILKRLAPFRRDEVSLPAALESPTTYADRVAQFRTVLESVGGRLLEACDEADAATQIKQLPVVSQARQLLSYCPQLVSSSSGVDERADPHELDPVDVTIAPGHFGVAENGAVWVADKAIKHRVALFLSQHLVLVIRSGELVSNMHEAYGRVGQVDIPFAGFISGPSKTADIEQSLVIGAHGARSLNVVLIRSCG